MSCRLGSLAPGVDATVTIVVRPTVTGTLSNAAWVESATNDPDDANDSDEEETTIVAAGGDTDAPEVSLEAPANGSSSSEEAPAFSGTAGTAPGDSENVTVKVYAGSSAGGTAVQTRAAVRSALGSYSVQASPPLAPGTYTAQAEQADAALNVGYSSANTFTVTDARAPEVTLTAPPDGSASNTTLPTFAGGAGTLPGDLPTITVKVYRGPTAAGEPEQILSTERFSGTRTGTYEVRAARTLGPGEYTAVAEQADNAGNTGRSASTTFVVTPVSPRGGPPAGGTEVKITGRGLSGAGAVKFGGTPATSYRVVDDSELRAVTPPHAAGTPADPTVEVTVTTASGDVATLGTFQYGPWSETGPLRDGQGSASDDEPPMLGGHTATRLQNGKVLFVGGLTDPRGAMLYDPKGDSWTPTGSLTDARSDHTATLLGDGKVLVAGGRDADDQRMKSVEIYNPATGRWSKGTDLLVARSHQTATLIAGASAECGVGCGKVLIAGGAENLWDWPWQGPTPVAAEVYDLDPSVNRSFATEPPAFQRIGATATQLLSAVPTECGATNCGRILVVGGDPAPQFRGIDGTEEPHIPELYDGRANAWKATGEEQIRRTWGHSAILLRGSATECGAICGMVLIAGGAVDPQPQGVEVVRQSELYNPVSELTRETENGSATDQPFFARYGHAAAQLPGGDVLVAGGNAAPDRSAELFDPLTQNWRAILDMLDRHAGTGVLGGYPSANLPPEEFPTATLLSGTADQCGANCGKVLVAGGGTRPELFDQSAIDAGPPAQISIGDASVREGNAGTIEARFTVSLSAASPNPVKVDFATEDGTARAPDDYAPWSGTLTLAPGDTSAPITVHVRGDTLDEPDETFRVVLSNPVNALVADAEATGTIIDDDPAATSGGGGPGGGGSGGGGPAPGGSSPSGTGGGGPAAGTRTARSHAARARGLRRCHARAARHTRRERTRARRGSRVRRARLRAHLRRHSRLLRKRCVARHGRRPGRVRSVRAKAISRTSIRLSFRAPGTDGRRGPAARTYLVKQSTRPIRSGRDFARAQALCSRRCRFDVTRIGTRLVLTVTDLRPRTRYYFSVAARDNVSGRLGRRSPAARVRTR